MIAYHCQGCGRTKDVPDNFAGRTVNCSCGASGLVGTAQRIEQPKPPEVISPAEVKLRAKEKRAAERREQIEYERAEAPRTLVRQMSFALFFLIVIIVCQISTCMHIPQSYRFTP